MSIKLNSRRLWAVLLSEMVAVTDKGQPPAEVSQLVLGEVWKCLEQYYYLYDVPGVSYWYHAESDSMVVHPPGSWPDFMGDSALLCEAERCEYIKWYEDNQEL